MKTTKIAYYITPHGFGHAVRSLEVIRVLMESRPGGVEITLVSDLPDFLVAQNVGRPISTRKKRLDVGLVQKDSIQFDLEASLRSLQELWKRHEELVSEESAFLKAEGIQGVVADIPFLAFYAASDAGLPAIGMSNFTWDWIYQSYAVSDNRWSPLIEWIQEGYRRCDLFLQLPMHGDCSICPRIEDVSLVARKARLSADEARNILGLDSGKKAYLIAFADLHLDSAAQKRLEGIDSAIFYYKQPLEFDFANGRPVDGLDLSYPDLVAAMDGVITKPGYGIVSDCLMQGTPIIYTDRGSFAEYEILVEAIEGHLANVYLPSKDLYAGKWNQSVRNLQSLPRGTPRRWGDGARQCARKILHMLDGKE